jgi:hypothetical protein
MMPRAMTSCTCKNSGSGLNIAQFSRRLGPGRAIDFKLGKNSAQYKVSSSMSGSCQPESRRSDHSNQLKTSSSAELEVSGSESGREWDVNLHQFE